MKAEINASASHEVRPAACTKLVACPFEVRIDGEFHDHFYDVRDAIASAHDAKRRCLGAEITVTDNRTNRLVIRVDV